MSRLIGPIRQIGTVVPDFEAALAYWTEVMGAGPFFISRRRNFDTFHYRGQPAPSPTVSIAFGQAGDVQIEIIAQHDDVPSGYRDFLDAGREGPQHMAYWFSDTHGYDAAYRLLSERGLAVRQENKGPGPRFAYFSAGEGVYPELELAEALLPSLDGWADKIKGASEGWDGTVPFRTWEGEPEGPAQED